jgi:hypothetical protein
MKNIRNLCLVLIVLAWPQICPAEVPHALGGFVLGEKMADFEDKVESSTVLPVRYLESLKEVETKDIWGFKTGLIYYGSCIHPPRILRIEFKYADSSKKFYDDLLEHYKQRFGEPDKWRGDPFHIVIAWKWSFTDRQGNSISLILQHNTRDQEEKQGNSVKMTMWNLMEQEAQCFEKNHPQPPNQEPFRYQGPNSTEWDHFIPH